MSDDPRLPAVPARTNDAYDALLADLRGIIASGRGHAAVDVNVELVLTYWSVGERIVREEQGGAERAAYGARLLARLGRILGAEFGRGFAEVSLQNMRRFYLAYPISSALRRESTWTHYLPARQPGVAVRVCVASGARRAAGGCLGRHCARVGARHG